MQTSGCCSATSARRLSVARPQKPVGHKANPKSEHGRERLPLWDGQPTEEIERWCAKLMEAAVRRFPSPTRRRRLWRHAGRRHAPID
jgi:hypothetical protein